MRHFTTNVLNREVREFVSCCRISAVHLDIAYSFLNRVGFHNMNTSHQIHRANQLPLLKNMVHISVTRPKEDC